VSTATIEIETAPVAHGYSELITRICDGDTGAMEEVYQTLLPGLRWMILRSLGPQDTDDVVNDTFLSAFLMIKKGAVREPERLPGYVSGIARIQIVKCIRSRVASRERESELDSAGGRADRQLSPEELARESEVRAVAREALKGLPDRYREILVRFYLSHQKPEEICHDLNLTPAQFRLIKTRAKDRFGRLGKKIVRRKQPGYSLGLTAEPRAALEG
jgi:RNA polymerase sigma-70 factor, ECF subfamily